MGVDPRVDLVAEALWHLDSEEHEYPVRPGVGLTDIENPEHYRRQARVALSVLEDSCPADDRQLTEEERAYLVRILRRIASAYDDPQPKTILPKLTRS